MTGGKTFAKAERLSHNSRIEKIFASGTAFRIYPLRILWMPFQGELVYPVQVLFTVSHKRFKKAVDRNRIKRKLKESYRLQKSFLYDALEKNNRKIILCIMYTGSDPNPPGDQLFNTLRQGIEMLVHSNNNLQC